MHARFRRQLPQRNAVVRRLTAAVRSLWPGSTLKVYGSCSCMLASAESDLDLVVCDWLPAAMLQACKAAGASRALQAECVQRVAAALRSSSFSEWIAEVAVTSSTVPIVSLACSLPAEPGAAEPAAVVNVDLSFYAPGHHGARAALFCFLCLFPLSGCPPPDARPPARAHPPRRAAP